MQPEVQNKVVELEQVLSDLPQVDIPLEHYFAPGVYVRSIFIPAGVVLTGKIHRTHHMNILAQGRIQVTTDDEVQTLDAPCVFNSEAGTKKAIHAITDAVFMNVHPTELTDIDEIEEVFIAPSYEALEQERREMIEQENAS